jgi:hypothetical protein
MIYFVLSYLLVTPSLAFAAIFFLLNTLFHGQAARQFLKDILFVFLEAPLWILGGIGCWIIILTMGLFPVTRIAAWPLLILAALAGTGYILHLFTLMETLIVLIPAAVGIAIAAWQFRLMLRM